MAVGHDETNRRSSDGGNQDRAAPTPRGNHRPEDRLVEANPGLTDAALACELERLHGVRLARRSITQYRKELSAGECRLRETAV